MPCFVPEEHKHLKWHVIKMKLLFVKHDGPYERAEWVNDERNGPTEKGHWVRWGYCGDFPSLCQAEYIEPSEDQVSPYYKMDECYLGPW